jgi:hypothetical protein
MQSGAKSAWEVIQQLSSDKQQSTLLTSLEIPWGFQSQAVLHWLSRGLCHAKKFQFKDLDKKKRYDSQSPNGRLDKKPLERKAEWEQNAGTNYGTRFPRASYFEKMGNMCKETWGRMYNVVSGVQKVYKRDKKLESHTTKKGAKKLVSSDVTKMLEKKVAIKIRETCEKTMFTPSNPIKATNPIFTT